MPELEARGADVVGLNCSVGPAAMLETLERMARVAHVKLVRAAQRRQAARDRRAQPLSLLARLHGVVRAALHQQRRPPGRRLLRHDAGSHPRTSRWRCARWRPARAPGGQRAARGRRPGRAACRRRCRASRSRGWPTRSRAAASSSASSWCRRAASRPTRSSSRRASCKIRGVDLVNIPDGPHGQRADERAVGRASSSSSRPASRPSCTTPAAIATCSAMQSDLLGAHAMGVRNVLLVTGDPPKVGDYPDATAVVRRRLDRPANVGRAAQRGARHRRPADRQPTGVSHRRRGQSRRAQPRRRAAPLRLQGRGGRRVRDHPAGVRRRRVQSLPRAGRARTRFRSSPASCRSRACGTPSSWPTRCPASACPTPCVERMRRADAAGRAAEEGLAIAREVAAEIRPLVRRRPDFDRAQGHRHGPGRHRRCRAACTRLPFAIRSPSVRLRLRSCEASSAQTAGIPSQSQDDLMALFERKPRRRM